MTWIQTYSGRKVYPLALTEDMVWLPDIARSLSYQCRFNGHCSEFYCPTPDQRVLTEDFSWVPAGDLSVGDRLIGFDEYPVSPGSAGKLRRRLRQSHVTATVPVLRRVFRMELAGGKTVCSSAEHPWLTATKVSCNQTWLTVEQIAFALSQGSKRYLHNFGGVLDIEEKACDLDRGWLAGILDGEGTLSGGSTLSFAQKSGRVLDKALAILNMMGVPYHLTTNHVSGVVYVTITGGRLQAWHVLERLHTVRISERAKKFYPGKQFYGTPEQIIRIYDEGEQWVAGIETSTHTYFCEGFGAHNSVAQHCVLISRLVPQEVALWGLLHDAAETYLSDIPRPVKHTEELTPFRLIEDKALRVIIEKFGLTWPMPLVVKEFDNILLATEQRDFMKNCKDVWTKDILPLGQRLIPWEPDVAERLFTKRFNQLCLL